ncbi:glycolate oxidase subunit GlcE [Niveibacterium sp. COAC-50]|uniref:glycolate oxidase subunit GlcE n=1 Tax=Niveibacterium sp. COAC-50 TaxID=2729384 RepID=UPI001557444A|nr:glycolate oxidase subunit GlcE [Niveibacterium sp. COAC-50]
MAAPLDPVLADWQARVRRAAASGQALVLQGGGSKRFLGRSPMGELLDTRVWSGIRSYEPTELVVTVRSGTPLAELEAVLAERGQMLAFEPPHFGPATVGGMVAAGLSGPRRASAGAVRDHLLGVTLMDGRGDILRFGGQVMKNVAGYDVSRLMAGAMGTLGLLLDVSLKVMPLPAAERTVRLSMTQADALRSLNRWGGQPLPLSASCWVDGLLHVRLSGAASAVGAAIKKIGGEVLEPAAQQAFWRALREQMHPFFAGSRPLWRLSVPSCEETIGAADVGLIEWGGALRWLRTPVEEGAALAEHVARQHGSAMCFRAGEGASCDVPFGRLSPALLGLHRRLKAAFDPAGVFNRARMYPDW